MLIKIISALIFWASLFFVILKVPYPDSLTSANVIQILGFFIPLFLAIIFTLNIFLKNIYISSSLSLGIVFLLILKALDSLNIVTGVLILIAVYLLVSYFKKSNRKSLTNYSKMPKLTKLKRGN